MITRAIAALAFTAFCVYSLSGTNHASAAVDNAKSALANRAAVIDAASGY